MMFRIDAIVAEHLEMFFGDVDDQTLDEIQCRNPFHDSFATFMTRIMKGDIFPIVIINAGGGNHRASKIASDILDCDIRGTEIGFGTDIESICMSGVH